MCPSLVHSTSLPSLPLSLTFGVSKFAARFHYLIIESYQACSHVVQEAAFLNSKDGPVTGPCDPAAKTAPPLATKDCSTTQVGGRDGTG